MAMIETNRMRVSANIIAPPTQTIDVYPVKDAFLDQKNPFFPFGEGARLQLQNKENESKKVIMAFEMPEIEPRHWDHLSKASLTLYADSPPTEDIHLILRYHQDDDWSEYGTTWAGQPLDYDYDLRKVVFPAGEKSLSIDLLDVLQNNGYDYNKYAFTILVDPDYGEQDTYFEIGSREAISSKKAPKLSYTYRYFPEGYDAADYYINFVVRQNKYKEFPINFGVKNGVASDDRFQINFDVKGYSGSNDEFPITFTPVPRVHDLGFDINFTVQQFNDSYFRINSAVKLHSGEYKGFDILTSVKGYKGERDLPTNVYVKNTSTIPININVAKYKDGSEFPINFSVKKYGSKEDYHISLKVNLHSGEDGFPINFRPRYKSGKEDGTIPVNLSVNKYNSHCDDFDINFTVKPNDICEKFLINMNVPGHNKEEEIPINFKVVRPAFLPINFTSMMPVEDEQFEIHLIVRPHWWADIEIKFSTKKASGSYAFIM